MKKGTKLYKLREWLEKGNTVSNKVSIERWNYYRLSDGIYVLRHKHGMNIHRRDVPNPSGDGGQYGIYWLEK